jgi:HEAT repeat protein
MILTHICRTIAIAGHAGDRETVLDGLDHDAPEVRVVALGAAHRLDALSADTHRPFLTDPATEVRYRAVELAARAAYGAELAHDLLGALADAELAEVAAFALGELSLDSDTLVRAEAALGAQASGHDDALARESAVAALGALGVGLEHILSATGDVATVRRRAVLALAPFEGPEVDQALEQALSDRDWQVRQAAEDLSE